MIVAAYVANRGDVEADRHDVGLRCHGGGEKEEDEERKEEEKEVVGSDPRGM